MLSPKFIWTRLRYNNLAQTFLDALKVLGVTIRPYYLFEEESLHVEKRDWDQRFADYEAGYLGPDDMATLAAFPDRTPSEAKLHQNLADGSVCFGIRLKGEIVAFTWWETSYCTFPGHPFALNDDEAYLHDAYTASAHRGLGLAAFVRYRAYEELIKQGRTHLYSVSERFNTSAVRFKKKINAKIIDQGVLVVFFSRWSCAHRRHRFHLAS